MKRVGLTAFAVMLIGTGMLVAIADGALVMRLFFHSEPWIREPVDALLLDSQSVLLLLGSPGVAYVLCRLGLSILSALRERDHSQGVRAA